MLAASARAQGEQAGVERNSLLLVRMAGDEDFVRRIEAELGASAFRLVHIGPAAELEDAPLGDLARVQGVVAAMRLDAGQGELELWVAGPEPGADGSTDLLSAGGFGERVLLLRAVETLRARTLARERAQPSGSGLEKPAPEPSASEPQPDGARGAEPPAAGSGEKDRTAAKPGAGGEERSADRAAPPSLRSYPGLWLELAPAVAYSPGGLGPALDGLVGVRLQPAPLWSVAAFALVPIWSERLVAGEGSAGVSTLLFGSGAFLQLIRSRLELGLGAGAGGAVAFTSGAARAPYSGIHDTAFSPLIFASPSLHWHLGGGLRVYARTLVGATLPRLTIRFGSSTAAHWGVPFVASGLGLELALLGR